MFCFVRLRLHPHETHTFTLLTFLFVFGHSWLTWAATTKGPDNIPTFQSKVGIVVEDVVVTTAKGEPVSGLHKENFRIYENGKEQKIVSFEEHKALPVIPAKLPPMPPNVFTNYPQIARADSVNVLLLDWLNTQPQDQAYVQAQVLKYLQHAAPDCPMAIFSLGTRLTLVQGFTTNFSALLSAVTSAKAGVKAQVSPLLPTSVEDAADRDFIAFLSSSGASQATIDAANESIARSSSSQEGARFGLTLSAFHELERFLASIPGRKNVIWFAGSFPMRAFPQGLTEPGFEPQYREVSGMLATSKIAIYPVSAEGLAGDATYSAEYEHGPSIEEENTKRAMNQVAMEELARDSGGQAFYNTNGLSDTIARITTEGEHYYTMAYTPSNKAADGSYRAIQVRLIEERYRLAYRRGYYAGTGKARKDPNLEDSTDPLLELMKFGLPDFAQILYKARVFRMERDEKGPVVGSNLELKPPLTRYGVDFAISADDIKFETMQDAAYHADVKVMLIAFDRGGRPLNLAVQRRAISFPTDAPASAKRAGIQLHIEIDVPPGGVFLRTGVYDFISGKAGTLGIPLNNVSIQR